MRKCRAFSTSSQPYLLSTQVLNITLDTFDETYRTALGFLSNPCKIWDSDSLEDKRLVLKLVFVRRLPYYRNEGFRTALTSCPFTILSALNGADYEMGRGLPNKPVNQQYLKG